MSCMYSHGLLQVDSFKEYLILLILWRKIIYDYSYRKTSLKVSGYSNLFPDGRSSEK